MNIPLSLRATLLTLALGFGLIAPLRAGGSADTRVGVEKFGEEPIRQLTLRLNDALDARQANVAIVGRAGRPREELPKGIRYTHVAFVVFEAVRDDAGEIYHTYTVYNLYQGADGRPDRSYLKQDLTYDFVAGIAEPDIAVCIPSAELQARILAVIRSPAYQALHTPDYNLVANPWVDRFDNCVTHTLKVCMAAIYETDDRTRIYRNIRAHFEPTRLNFGPIKMWASRRVEGLSHEDRDPSGLQTASYDSLLTFLEQNGLVKEAWALPL